MSAPFLHGSETIILNTGPRQITVSKSSVIGLIGIAPKGDANKPILVSSVTDSAQFGSQVPGFNIPQALEAIIANGGGPVIVVNCFLSSMTTQVTDESHTVASRKVALAYAPISNLTLTYHPATGADTAMVAGTHYTIDDYGKVLIISDTIPEAGTVKASYKKLDAAAVTADILNGSVDGTTGLRTGMECFDLTYNLFGFNPKIFIAPGYTTLAGVAAALTVKANKFKGFTLRDAPVSTTVAVALAGRGPSGTFDNFKTSSAADCLLYPMLKAYDPATNTTINKPYSAFFAGLWSFVINNEGFWVSPSNHQIQGITGVEVDLSASIDDANCDVNTLNAAGIITIFNTYGTGIRSWGNSTSAYPSSTLPRDRFMAVRMASNVLDESIRWSMLQFIDKPVDQAWIDSVCESVNSFIRTLIGIGALVDGKCLFDISKNPTVEMAAGHYTFSYSFASPTPGERVTFESTYDINLLKTLK